MSDGGKVLLLWLAASVLPAQQPAEPSPAPVLVYDRRPLRVPLACRAEEFQAAGLECSEKAPCRVFLELAAVEAAGAKVVAAGNLHTASATISSLLLMSDDSGVTWSEPFQRLPGAGFEGIQFLDAQYGWIAVQPQGALPVDPQFLLTADGGKTWRKASLWDEEGRAGLLAQFHFDSRQHGLALVDRSAAGQSTSRYELYETQTGGVSWSLREASSRPISPKWPARASEWRVRDDPKLRTYEIERRAGENWRRVANFSSDLGACKSLEAKPAAAPANPEVRPNP